MAALFHLFTPTSSQHSPPSVYCRVKPKQCHTCCSVTPSYLSFSSLKGAINTAYVSPPQPTDTGAPPTGSTNGTPNSHQTTTEHLLSHRSRLLFAETRGRWRRGRARAFMRGQSAPHVQSTYAAGIADSAQLKMASFVSNEKKKEKR